MVYCIIILSFALQNFSQLYVIISKTTRYYAILKALNTSLIFIFLKITLTHPFLTINTVINGYLHFFYNVFFYNSFWLFFKKIYFKENTFYTNNLVKSSIYKTLSTFNNLLFSNQLSKANLSAANWVSPYLKPVVIINFAFNKQLYNSFMFYIMSISVKFYSTPFIPFNINYSFIFLQKEMYLYQVLNCFYFKLRNV